MNREIDRTKRSVIILPRGEPRILFVLKRWIGIGLYGSDEISHTEKYVFFFT